MGVASRKTRIQPPGGVSHFDNQDMLPESANIKQETRVLKPPGGMSSPIFSETDSTTSSNESRASSTSPKTPQKVYRMASNFELGDEQPENPPARRKPFKPSGTMIRRKISVQWLPKVMRLFHSVKISDFT